MDNQENKKSLSEEGKSDEEQVELTNDDKSVLTLQEVGMFAPTVRAIVLETAQTVEGRLSKTLANQINDMIKPLKRSRIEYLEQELNVANFIMMEIQETYLGMYLLKRIHKKIKKDAETKEKGRSDRMKEHFNQMVAQEVEDSVTNKEKK